MDIYCRTGSSCSNRRSSSSISTGTRISISIGVDDGRWTYTVRPFATVVSDVVVGPSVAAATVVVGISTRLVSRTKNCYCGGSNPYQWINEIIIGVNKEPCRFHNRTDSSINCESMISIRNNRRQRRYQNRWTRDVVGSGISIGVWWWQMDVYCRIVSSSSNRRSSRSISIIIITDRNHRSQPIKNNDRPVWA